MEVTNVLHMKGGSGETSYANNSIVQGKVISMTKPIREEAITQLYTTMFPKVMGIADLGCSSGPNTFFVSTELIKTIDNLRRKHGQRRSPEFQINLNDIPSNDFNLIYQSLLPMFQAELRHEFGPCFVHGTPGTFYGRLFASQSLHFVHSSYSLMWLSKIYIVSNSEGLFHVPEGVEMNKQNIYMSSTSPPEVIHAYYEQFRRDFLTFLQCRSEEVVLGGKMVLTLLGRKSDDPCSKEGSYIWELLGIALQEMISEGLVEEEKLHSFHIPQYTPSPKEVAILVKEEGSFTINRLESSEITWTACGNDLRSPEYLGRTDEDGYSVANCIRSVVEPLLLQHFGELPIDRLFHKYGKIVGARMSKEDAKFVNVTVSITRQEKNMNSLISKMCFNKVFSMIIRAIHEKL